LLASLQDKKRKELLQSISEEDALKLIYDWHFWARPNQIAPPGDWRYWLLLAGRGFGKTRTGAEWIREQAENAAKRGIKERFAIIGGTAADTRDTMVEGEAGILAVSHPDWYPLFKPSKRRLIWPDGTLGTLYSADKPARLRGPAHHKGWLDELAIWRYEEAYSNFDFGLRLGEHPQAVISTTPKRVKLIRELVADATIRKTKGNTYQNLANLAPGFIKQILGKYEGTHLGRQELYAELLEDAEGALWSREQIDDDRRTKHPPLKRIVVAVDPATTSNPKSNETGIIVAGVDSHGEGWLLDDRSLLGTPKKWAEESVAGYNNYAADRVVGEANNGGDLVEVNIRTVDKTVSFKKVHASKGKFTRAEPVSALCEQHKIHHVGNFALLEDELCSWEPDSNMPSPNRLDAYVWAFTELMLKKGGGGDLETETTEER